MIFFRHRYLKQLVVRLISQKVVKANYGKCFEVPKVQFYNGHQMPIIGLGTMEVPDPEITRTSVRAALDAGYRLFDTAFLYRTETALGEVLAEYIKDGKLKREEVFIATKLPANGFRPEDVKRFCEKSLKALKLDYIDLYLIHWPMSFKRSDNDDEVFVIKDGDVLVDDVDHLKTWEVMEKLVGDGLTKSIGLSNFNSKQIQRVYDAAKIKPASLQVECHPYLPQNELIELCQKLNIKVTAYSPLGSPGFPAVIAQMGIEIKDPKLLDDEKLKSIAEKHKKTIAQVLLKFNVQRGVAVIPCSKNADRIKENINIFNFTLDSEDIEVLKSMKSGCRYIKLDYFPAMKKHPEYPFSIPY